MTADKNCIPINTHESRFSKTAERIKSKNTGPGSSLGRGHCVVFLGKTLHSHGEGV